MISSILRAPSAIINSDHARENDDGVNNTIKKFKRSAECQMIFSSGFACQEQEALNVFKNSILRSAKHFRLVHTFFAIS